MHNTQKIGAAIRYVRESKNLMLKQLAIESKMDVTQLWSIENNRNSPSVRTLARIADALGVETGDFFRIGDFQEGAHADTPNDPSTTMAMQSFRIVLDKDGREIKSETLAAELDDAQNTERSRQAELRASLPLETDFPISTDGADMLSTIVRRHLDAGSVVIRNIYDLFETHGIRIIWTRSLRSNEIAATLYSRKYRDFTVFVDKSKKAPEWRKEFQFLSNVAKIFIFAKKHYKPFKESESSKNFARRFAASFLLPDMAVRNTVYALRVKPDDWTIELLLRLKNRFGVSAETFNKRLKELSLISSRLHAKFESEIKAYYKKTNYGEPKPHTPGSSRADDLKALDETTGNTHIQGDGGGPRTPRVGKGTGARGRGRPPNPRVGKGMSNGTGAEPPNPLGQGDGQADLGIFFFR